MWFTIASTNTHYIAANAGTTAVTTTAINPNTAVQYNTDTTNATGHPTGVAIPDAISNSATYPDSTATDDPATDPTNNKTNVWYLFDL